MKLDGKKNILEQTKQTNNKVSYAGGDELWINEQALPNYSRDIVKKIASVVNMDSRVLEFGAGIGTLSELWFAIAGKKPECVEIDPELRDIVIARGYVCHKELEDTEGYFDCIYSSNVLEHIEDDLFAIENINKKLKSNGILVLYLPAFQMIYNKFDAKLGHYRRYNKKDIYQKLNNSNFKIVNFKYCDSLGFFAWIFKNYQVTNNKKSEFIILSIYDKYIYKLSKILDLIGFNKFLGKNIFIVARKIKK